MLLPFKKGLFLFNLNPYWLYFYFFFYIVSFIFYFVQTQPKSNAQCDGSPIFRFAFYFAIYGEQVRLLLFTFFFLSPSMYIYVYTKITLSNLGLKTWSSFNEHYTQPGLFHKKFIDEKDFYFFLLHCSGWLGPCLFKAKNVNRIIFSWFV